MMDYYNGVNGFINCALSNPKILLEKVLNVHVRDVKIKFLDPNIVMMHLL